MNHYFNYSKYTHLLSSILLIAICTSTLATEANATNVPLLRCAVTYAGTTHTIESRLSKDPYLAPMHDIGGRFSFKALMIGEQKNIQYIKLYAYLQGRDTDTIIHQATYLAPFRPTKSMRVLTPHNHLYAGEVEREMQYQCSLGWTNK
jgi:hypothetical protein